MYFAKILNILAIIVSISQISQASIRSNFDISGLELNDLPADIRLELVMSHFTNDHLKPKEIIALPEKPFPKIPADKYLKVQYQYMKFTNTSNETKRIVVSSSVSLDSNFYVFHKGELSLVPKLEYRSDAALVELAEGETTLFYESVFPFNIDDSGLSWGVKISSESYFNKVQFIDGRIDGLVFGVVFVMLITNSVMFLVFRKAYFLYYSFYTLGVAVIIAVLNGYLEFHTNFLSLLYIVTYLISIKFIDSALEMREKTPRIYRSMIRVAIISGFLTIPILVSRNPLTFNLLFGIILPFFVSAAYCRWRDGYKPAMFYLAGFSIFFLGVFIAGINQVFLRSMYLYWVGTVAWLFEICFFSLGIALKVRMNEQKAQADSLHAFEQLSKIVYPHQIEAIKSGQRLEKTMPVHQGKAYVIAFDIIKSSKIEHPKAKEFFRIVFKRCYEAMRNNYSEHHFKSDGYRIKEMGDGFLCSVGYPFFSDRENLADLSLELCQNFYRILQEEQTKLNLGKEISCCMGISFGNIQGFYPESGVKEYDLFGKSIVQATRYESLRKSNLVDTNGRSCIFLQATVHAKLSANYQQSFTTIDLSQSGFRVADDPTATRVHFSFLGEWSLPANSIKDGAA